MDASTAAMKQQAERLMSERVRLVEALRRANANLDERMERLPITVWYDVEDDVLTITIGDPVEATTESFGAVLLRLDPETLEYVGLEIPDFRRALEAHRPDNALMIAKLGPFADQLMRITEPRRFTAEELRSVHVAEAVRELVPA